MKIEKKLIYVSLMSVFWSLVIVFNKNALNKGAVPLPFTLQTTMTSAMILLFYTFILKTKEIKKVKKHHLKFIILIGLFAAVAYSSGTYGLTLSTSINYGFLIKTTLVFTTLLAFLFLKEPINIKKIALIFTLLLGAYLITTGGALIIPRTGDVFIVLAAFCLSLAVIIQKPIVMELDPDVVTTIRAIFSSIFLLMIIPLISSNPFMVNDIKDMIFVSSFSALTVIFLSKTISVATASYMTMMTMMTPILVSVIGYFWLGESMNIIQILGGTLIIISGILIQKHEI